MPAHESSTIAIPPTGDVPRHVAIIMDGNGRWAKKRFLPRVAGHRKGVEAVREVVKSCASRGVKCLTLFAFSSENWRRPSEEVNFLMQLFLKALEQEIDKLHRNGIRFKVIGDLSVGGNLTRGASWVLTYINDYGSWTDLTLEGYDREAAQAAADAERVRVASELARLNEAYERRFGFRYCVFVAGRPRAALLRSSCWS